MMNHVDGADASYRPGYAVAADRIIGYIEQNGLQQGDRLPTEADFATMLGVSRSITRDAVKTLAALGRVSSQRGRGIFVAGAPTFSPTLRGEFTPTNVDDVMMLFEFRAIQEKAAAEFAAIRATPAELMTVERALAEYAANVETRDYTALSFCDVTFHTAVNKASRNPFLVDSAQAAMTLQREVVSVAFGGYSGGPVEAALEEHTAIFNAIRHGDAAAAGAAAAAHVDRTRRGYQEEIGRRVFQTDLQ